MHSNWTETAEQIEARRRRIVAEANPHEWDTQPVKPVKKASPGEKAIKALDAFLDIPMTAGFWRALVWVMAIALVIQIALTAAGLLTLKVIGG